MDFFEQFARDKTGVNLAGSSHLAGLYDGWIDFRCLLFVLTEGCE
jgi:hypothetical protein